MKTTLSILFCLLISSSLSAYSEKNANGTDGAASYTTEKSTETKELEAKSEAESSEQQEEVEPDSSYYSVNKFNFLFYFVYKMKYMDHEPEVESPKN